VKYIAKVVLHDTEQVVGAFDSRIKASWAAISAASRARNETKKGEMVRGYVVAKEGSREYFVYEVFTGVGKGE